MKNRKGILMSKAKQQFEKRISNSGKFAIAPTTLWYQLITAKSSGKTVDLSGGVRFIGWTSTPVLWLLTIPTALVGAGMALGSLAAFPIEACIEVYQSMHAESPTEEKIQDINDRAASPVVMYSSGQRSNSSPKDVTKSFTLLDSLLNGNEKGQKKEADIPVIPQDALKISAKL